MKRNIDVCLSPDLLHLYDLGEKVVVVIDILRATSCMTTGLAHGVKSITPVATLEECKALQQQGYIAAAERDGKKADGFDLGNSPFSYMEADLRGKQIAMTTTNGTLALDQARKAKEIVIGSFLNRKALVDYLVQQPHDVVLLCAGWKGKINLEDSLFAGAIVEDLKAYFSPDCDAPLMAQSIYKASKADMLGFLQQSSHVKRLHKLNLKEDIVFCLQINVYDVVPVLHGKILVNMQSTKAFLV